MSYSETFSVTVESPHGKRAIENFHHWINKVSDDAEARWGIKIRVERESEETEHNTEFNQ